MVMDKLHIICGNCGCNNDFKLEIDRLSDDVTDIESEFEDGVTLTCNNCATNHDLKKYANKIIATREKI